MRLFRDAGAECLQLIGRGGPGEARFHARDYLIILPGAFTGARGPQGSPQVHGKAGTEAAGHDPHHGVRLAAQSDGPAQRRGIFAEHAPPEIIAQNRDRGAAGGILGAAELPSQPRSDPQNPEESGGNALLPDVFEMSLGREVDAAVAPKRRHIQGTRAIADTLEEGSGLVFLLAFLAVLAPVGVHQRQAVEPGVGCGAQQDGVQHAVDGGVGADREAQRSQYHEREGRTLAKLAKGEAGVVPERHRAFRVQPPCQIPGAG
jgi:hypothetical protein